MIKYVFWKPVVPLDNSSMTGVETVQMLWLGLKWKMKRLF